MDSDKLRKALRELTRVDGCSLSWDVNDAVDDALVAIEELIEYRIRAALEAAAAGKI